MGARGRGSQGDGPPAEGGRRGLSMLGRAGIALLGLMSAWAVGYFGPGLWESAKVVIGQDPLTVAVLHDYQVPTAAEFHFDASIVPRKLSGMEAVSFDDEATFDSPPLPRGWDFSPDEVDAMTTAKRFVFTGARADAVTIQRFSTRILARRAPLRGIKVVDPSGGEGLAAEVRYLRADLDTGKITWRDGANKPIPPLALVLGRGDQVVIDLIAATMKCDCDWVFDVTYSVGSETGTLTVPAKGSFRTSALSRAALWDMGAYPDMVCEDFVDLKPTMCDRLPAGSEDQQHLSVVQHKRTGKFATGFGLWVEE